MSKINIIILIIFIVAFAIIWFKVTLPYLKNLKKARTLRNVKDMLQENKIEEAINLLRNTADTKNLNDPAFSALFTVLISYDRMKEAEELLESVPDELKRTDEYSLQRGYLFYLKKDYNTAKSLYQSIIDKQSPKKGLALSNLGALLVQTGEATEVAIKYLKEALNENPSNPANYGIYFNISLAYLNLKQYNEALLHAEVGLDLLPKDSFPSNKAYAHHIMSKAYRGLGNLKEAKKQLMLAYELTPSGSARDKLKEELEGI
ncbi:MAG: hypothetical protein JXA60_06135 [Candidatus Coatesbacteria bacterium]|nr:hypothetical protein [Candidatus Coatesbacteria bacterium]